MNHIEPFDPESAIQRARGGDVLAIAKLVENYRPYLRFLANLSLKPQIRAKIDASDIVQEASMLAMRDIRQFRGDSEKELAAWLRRVVINTVANSNRHFTRDRRNVELEQKLQNEFDESVAGLSRLASNESTPSQQLMRREHAVLLAEALDKLPDEYHEILILREFRGLSLAEIAEHFGRTRNSVQKLWARAIQAMRRNLKDTL